LEGFLFRIFINMEYIIDKIKHATSNYIVKDEEDYGLDKEMFKWFKRRYAVFIGYLASVIDSVQTNEYEWLLEFNKNKFVEFVLIYSLLDFFYNLEGKHYDVEDFQRDGSQDKWLYFVKDIYGNLLGEMYDELKSNEKITENNLLKLIKQVLSESKSLWFRRRAAQIDGYVKEALKIVDPSEYPFDEYLEEICWQVCDNYRPFETQFDYDDIFNYVKNKHYKEIKHFYYY